MRYCYTILFFILANLGAIGQDQIFTKDNRKIEAKITEVSPVNISYRLYNSTDSSVKILPVSKAALIVYQSGEHQVFAAPEAQYRQPVPDSSEAGRHANSKAQFDSLTRTRQVLFFDPLQLMDGSISIGYLREFFHHRMSAYLPVSVGIMPPVIANNLNFFPKFSSFPNYKYLRKSIDVSLAINVHLNPTKRFTYFIGPLFGVAQYNGSYDTYTYYSGAVPVHKAFVMNNYYFIVNNGGLFRITSHFNIMINAGIGYQEQHMIAGELGNYASVNNPVLNTVRIGVHLGYRF